MPELRADCDQSLVDEYFEQELAKASLILPKWDGSTAWFWGFDRSLFSVMLRLEKRGIVGNLTIVCTTPISMMGPFEWTGSRLRIDRDKRSFVVRDDDVSFLLRAHVVDVIENADPLCVIFVMPNQTS